MSVEKLKKGISKADGSLALMMSMVIFLLIFKLPPLLLDLLLVFSISAGFLILLLTIYVDSPIQLSSFPSILLVMTLFKLSLNVASTKLILLDGQAGSVISAFGATVIGGSYVVGTVIFLILVMIQFKVITAGSGRISEVSARFTLDAMPGKQMSIDADLNAGIIDETEAQAKREELNEEAAFYGSMDGANKFVKGDVTAGLIITVINICGGLAIGYFQRDMEIADALRTYTILTIGDGLVSQIPSLVISVASGILVTRASSKGGMGEHLSSEIFAQSTPLFACGGILGMIAILPGLPFFPFFVLSAASLVAGVTVKNRIAKAEKDQELLEHQAPEAIEGADPLALPPTGEDKKTIMRPVLPMALEIGFSLVPLVDNTRDGDLIDRLGNIRRQVYDELGFRIPPISVNDNIELGSNEYRILIRGLERARGQVHVGSHMAINPGDVLENIEGIKTIDPAFGFEAVWINAKRVETAESYGYTVVDAASVVTTHITKIVREYSPDLLSRQDVSTMVDNIKESHPAVVEELIPDRMNIGVVHRVLQGLLSEAVPIHDIPTVLETLSDYSGQTQNPTVLTEFCRNSLKGHITANLLAENNVLYALTLSPDVESEIQESIQQDSGIGVMAMAPDRAAAIVQKISEIQKGLQQSYDSEVTLLVSPLIRYHVHQLVSRKIDDMPVVSYSEISDDLPVEVLGAVAVPKGGIAAA